MNEYEKAVRVAITPITPVHIGNGEVFESTNYVISEDWLYHFNAARAPLNDLQRSDLIRFGESGDISQIQRFFRDNAKSFIPVAKTLVPVTREVASDYDSKIGKRTQTKDSGRKDINQLQIFRTSYNTVSDSPYLPGSSVKGAIRTAVLEGLSCRFPHIQAEVRRHAAYEQQLLGMNGTKLSEDAFRLVKVSDMQPTGTVARQVVKTQLFKKHTGLTKRKQSTLREVILPGTYRAFAGDIRLAQLAGVVASSGVPPENRRIKNVAEIAMYCNNFYQPQLQNERVMLQKRGLGTAVWLDAMEQLFMPGGEVAGKLERGQAFLLRLGMLGGAESKQIKINQGKNRPPTYQSETQTVWLASLGKETQKGQPFGWVLVEIEPKGDNTLLKNWCEKTSLVYPDVKKKLDELNEAREQAIREKALADARRQEALRLQAEEKAKAQAAEKAEEERKAALSDADREIEEIVAIIESVKKGDAGGQAAATCRERLKKATEWTNREDKQRLAETAGPLLKKKDLTSKKFKEVLQELRSGS